MFSTIYIYRPIGGGQGLEYTELIFCEGWRFPNP